VLGTSLNAPLSNSTFAGHFSFSCPDGDGYVECNDGWFYDHDLQIALYDPRPRSFFEIVLDTFRAFVIDPVRDVFKLIFGLDNEEESPLLQNLDFIAERSDFRKLYRAKEGIKTVIGVKELRYSPAEGRMVEYIGIDYRNFTEIPDMCGYIEEYDALHNEERDFSCSFDNTTMRHTVFSRTGLVDDVWRDLTSALRLR
jgi:hypothetical protein